MRIPLLGRAVDRAPRSRGAVAVEFALVLPLFLALIFGIIDGGRLMMTRWLVSYAVARGGRVASLRTSTLQNVKDAVAQSASLIGLSASNVNGLMLRLLRSASRPTSWPASAPRSSSWGRCWWLP